MSEDQFKAFIAKAQADTSLQKKLKAAADANTVVAIAKAAGFSITADDLPEVSEAELSDEELEGVAGGVSSLFNWLEKYSMANAMQCHEPDSSYVPNPTEGQW